jgi:L-glutamine:2-deoxy-scyllo-inosose/3-amino-2,3-dideoxy-scyllo-inosose aminotransferase
MVAECISHEMLNNRNHSAFPGIYNYIKLNYSQVILVLRAGSIDAEVITTMAKLAISGGPPVTRLSTPNWPIYGHEERRRILKVLESGIWAYDGEMETSFNEAWATFNGSKHALSVTNGTHALQLAYEALDIGWGDEVLVPASTWQATAAAVLDVNAVPVLVDIDLDTWCLDPKAAEAAITSRTKAIATVHLYGCMSDMDAIMDIASRHGLYVVEDCSHQHGSQWQGKNAGTIGDIGTFSHQSSKVLNSGEGGSVLVQDDKIFYRLEQLRNCGHFSRQCPENERRYLQSGNYRIGEFQAALLLSQLERLPEQLEQRDACGQQLNAILEKAPGVCALKRYEAVMRQSYYMYAFRFIPEEWEGINIHLFRKGLSAETGLGFGGGYEPLNKCSLYQPLTKQRHRLDDAYYQRIDAARYKVPNAERMAYREGVCLSHTNLLLDPADMDKIGEAIDKLYTNQAELRKAEV